MSICPTCGQEIEPKYEVPLGCVCDPRDWGNPLDIPQVCQSWDGPNGDGLCRNCEHLEGCHSLPGAARAQGEE